MVITIIMATIITTMVITTMAIGVTATVITMVICTAGRSSCTRLTGTFGSVVATLTIERR